MDDNLSVSVVIPVKNEQANIAHCLERLRDFSEVVVVDSDSTDNTRQIALDHGAKVINFTWNGHFPKKRNWCLQNHKFANPWVLFVDADEYVTDQFVDELRRTLPNTKYVGFQITYRNYFLDRFLRHGESFRKLALFRIGSGLYERIEEDNWSSLDMEVHEHPILNGPIGRLRQPITHQDFKGMEAYLNRHNEYSSWEASRYMALRRGSPNNWKKLTRRQRLKYRLMNSYFLGPLYFFAGYIGKLGLLDGRAGFIFAILKMYYFIQIKCKINALRQAEQHT